MAFTRASAQVYLIGVPYTQILGSKLPSKKQVLSVFFFNHRTLKLTLRDSAALVHDELAVFWAKARIPIQSKHRSIEKILAIHGQWQTLLKTSKRRTDNQQQKETAFMDDLNDLFDIAAFDALERIMEEDKQFLILQRQKGRPGSMAGIDKVTVDREKRRLQRLEQESERERKAIAASTTTSRPAVNQMEIDLSGSVSDDGSQPDPFIEQPDPSRGKRNVINERVTAALDRCKISDRNAIHLIIAIVDALGHNANDFIINRSTLRNTRRRNREAVAMNLKTNYKLQPSEPCVVHFDGKLLPDIMSSKKVDRQPVIVSNRNGDQLLGIPRINNSTGAEISSVVYETLANWGLLDNVRAVCCDTTAANMGRLNGAVTLLEQQIGRPLIKFPCRHHIFELVLRAAFEEKLGSTSAPVVLIFKRFKDKWGMKNIK